MWLQRPLPYPTLLAVALTLSGGAVWIEWAVSSAVCGALCSAPPKRRLPYSSLPSSTEPGGTALLGCEKGVSCESRWRAAGPELSRRLRRSRLRSSATPPLVSLPTSSLRCAIILTALLRLWERRCFCCCCPLCIASASRPSRLASLRHCICRRPPPHGCDVERSSTLLHEGDDGYGHRLIPTTAASLQLLIDPPILLLPPSS